MNIQEYLSERQRTHVRTRDYRSVPEWGAIDEGAQIYRDSILPSTQQLKGFKDVITLGDRSTGKAMVITFWETEADAQAAITSGFVREQSAKFAHLLSGAPAPISEVFEVVPVK